MVIRKMKIDDYDSVYDLWLNTPGMGLNDLDDSRQGIERYLKRNPETCFVANKVALVVLTTNELGNSFWEKRGFIARDDLVYRNKAIHELKRMDISFKGTAG